MRFSTACRERDIMQALLLYLSVFSGCNLKCDFCDTLHEEGTEMENGKL